MTDSYVPGVCNIGPAEIRRRRTIGIAGSGAAVVVLAACLAVGAPRPVRALVALPATAGASGFLQAAAHFCSGFGLRGVFAMGRAAAPAETVEQAEDRDTDRRRAIGILGAAGAVGASAAAFALALP